MLRLNVRSAAEVSGVVLRVLSIALEVSILVSLLQLVGS